MSTTSHLFWSKNTRFSVFQVALLYRWESLSPLINFHEQENVMYNLIYQKETTWGSCAVTGTGGWNTAFSGHTGDFTGGARDGCWVGGLAIGGGFVYRCRGHTVCGLRQTGGGETWEESTLSWPYFHFQILLWMSYDSVKVSCTVKLCYSHLNLWKAKLEVSSTWTLWARCGNYAEDRGNFTLRNSNVFGFMCSVPDAVSKRSYYIHGLL